MRIIIKNLGPIESMEFDLSSPMTIFTGLNGTGKTYISYLIYSLYNLAATSQANISGLEPLDNVKSYKGKLDTIALYSAYKECLKYLQKLLPFIYNDSEDVYKDTRIEPIPFDEFKAEVYKEEFGYNIKPTIFLLEKGANSFEYKLSVNENIGSNKPKSDIVDFLLLRGILTNGNLHADMMLAERSGIYTFSKELSLNRLRLPNVIEGDDRITRYPYPMREALVKAEDWANRAKKTSSYAELADRIEEEIVGGKVSVTDNGEIRFQGKSMDRNIPYPLASSSVKTISGLILYLRHEAAPGNLLIIDEPETNVHPNNQVLMARIFVKMINARMRLLINTHSDHIIREINNMIMLSSLDKDEDTAEYGYTKDEVLKKEDVAAYYFDFAKQPPYKVNVERMEIAETGFDVKSIDDTIEQLNERASNLYYAISK